MGVVGENQFRGRVRCGSHHLRTFPLESRPLSRARLGSALPANMSELAETYIAEKLVATRKVKGVREFRVRWVGYEPSEDTWEPRAHLLDKSLVKEYEPTPSEGSISECSSDEEDEEDEQFEVRPL